MFCGIDLGTSSLKCALIAEDGTLLGRSRAPVGLYNREGRWVAEPLEWLRALAQAYAGAHTAAARSGPGRDMTTDTLRAVAISGNGPTLVPVGQDGLPAGPALSWMDRGATTEAATVSALAGRPVDPSFYLPKALRARAETATPIARFFSGPEYLAFLLGARPVSYLADPRYDQYIWDLAILEKLGMDPGMVPGYVAPATVIGSVSHKAAEAVGLPAGLPIVSAFPDFLAALVGSGTVRTGIACDRAGSSEALNVCADTPFGDASIFSLPHAIPGKWNLSGGLSTSGKALEWFSAVAGYSGMGADTVYQDAGKGVRRDDDPLFVPYLAGERAPLWNRDLRGAFLGLSVGHTRHDMARAVVESLVFGLRLVADKIRDGGFPVDVIRCTGTPARDDAMNTLKADSLGVCVEVPAIMEAETLGDACVCAVALGDRKNLLEASLAMTRTATVFEPEPARTRAQQDRYLRWLDALDAATGFAAAADGRTRTAPDRSTGTGHSR